MSETDAAQVRLRLGAEYTVEHVASLARAHLLLSLSGSRRCWVPAEEAKVLDAVFGSREQYRATWHAHDNRVRVVPGQFPVPDLPAAPELAWDAQGALYQCDLAPSTVEAAVRDSEVFRGLAGPLASPCELSLELAVDRHAGILVLACRDYRQVDYACLLQHPDRAVQRARLSDRGVVLVVPLSVQQQ